MSNRHTFAQSTIVPSSKEAVFFIGKKTQFLEQKEGENIDFENLSKPENQKRFKLNQHKVFTRPPAMKTYWFKFTVSNPLSEDIWLEVGNTYAAYIDFYYPDSSGNYQVHKTGGYLHTDTKVYPVFSAYWFPLNKARNTTVTTYYLRLEYDAPNEAPLQIGTLKALQQQNTIREGLAHFFVGVILIMSVYHLFLLFFTKDKVYVWYIGYLLSVLFFATFVNSFPLLPYFFGDKYKYIVYFNLYVFFYPVLIFTYLFSNQYLGLKQNAPQAKKVLEWMLLLTAFFIIIEAFGFISNALLSVLFQSLTTILCIVSFVTAIYLYFVKKQKQARFYILAWVFYFTGIIIFVLELNGIATYNLYLRNALYFGVILEISFFSAALGDRFNFLREEKEEIQSQNLKLIENQKETLRQKVEERTQELQESNEEMQVMNEELRQTQEEVQAQRDFVEEQNKELHKYNKKLESNEQVLRKMNNNIQKKNEKLAFINNQIELSIKSAQTIQQALLPTEEKLSSTLNDYFLMFKPRDVVSGDFYWVTKEENFTYLVVSDCTGHGVPGAFMANMGTLILYNIIKRTDLRSPAQILEELHSEIFKALKQETTHNKNGMDTAIVRIEERGEECLVTFAGAKQDFYYLNSDSSKELVEVKGARRSIGGIQRMARPFEDSSIVLRKGSLLYLGSDGFKDQNDKERKKFGKQRLKELIETHHALPLEKQKAIFEAALAEHMKETSQRDDILWVGVRV